MKIGDMVRVTKCDVCPKVVGKTAKITGITESDAGVSSVMVNFGKGRPQLNRPTQFSPSDMELVTE